jgi:S-adenosylhomocysteine hydrolase
MLRIKMIQRVKYANNITHDNGAETVAVMVEMDKKMVEKLYCNHGTTTTGFTHRNATLRFNAD